MCGVDGVSGSGQLLQLRRGEGDRPLLSQGDPQEYPRGQLNGATAPCPYKGRDVLLTSSCTQPHSHREHDRPLLTEDTKY